MSSEMLPSTSEMIRNNTADHRAAVIFGSIGMKPLVASENDIVTGAILLVAVVVGVIIFVIHRRRSKGNYMVQRDSNLLRFAQ
jgi:hypothetical protein